MVEKEFDYKGFPCVITFNPLGFRCGYVGITSDFIPIDAEKIICHGGITYNKKSLPDGSRKGIRWIGFDCGHGFDGIDMEKLEMLYKDNRSIMRGTRESEKCFASCNKRTVKNMEYCEEQCKEIVDQILGETNER